MNKPLIRIVDDDNVFRESLQYMLEAEGYTTASYGTAHDFLTQDRPSVFGLAILDYQMDQMDGLELLKELNHRNYPQPILFLSAHGNLPVAVQAMKLGSLDFIEKSAAANIVIERISEILETHRLRQQSGIPIDAACRMFHSLPTRRQEVATLLSNGLLKRQIADRLGISVKTVESHCLNIYSALGIHSSAELAAIVKVATKLPQN